MPKRRKLEQNDVVSPPPTLSHDVVSPPESPPLSHDDLLQIIKPFTHNQLSEIVITASLRHPDVVESIRSIADVNPSRRSLSIQNLDQSTTTKRLAAFFAKFGELEKAEVVRGKISRKCIGYVVYKHVDSALLALKEPSKLIDGKITVVELVDDAGKSKKAGLGTVDVSLRRVYIGNVVEGMDCEKLLGCFEKYGEIEEGPGGFDKETRKFRGVAFIVYRNVEGVKACLVDPVKVVDGRKLCCRLDVCKEEGSVQRDRGGRVLGVGDEGLGKGKLETVDVSSRRVCVGNVPAEMDCGKLLKHFEMYGEIEDGPLGFDRKTGKFKGFAFIVYRNVEGVKACLVDPVKIIDGHELNCRLASFMKRNISSLGAPQAVTAAQVPGSVDGGKGEVVISKQKSSKKGSSKNEVVAKEKLETVDVSLRRVYVGNVPTEMDCEKLLEHFSTYGEVEGGPLGFDKKTGKFKGFAFIVYKNLYGVRACLVDPVKIIDGHKLDCRLAVSKQGNLSGVAASQVVTAAQVPGLGDGGNTEVVISKQKSSKKGSLKNRVIAKENLETVDFSLRRVYIRNVPTEMECEKLLEHFSMYGEVEGGPLRFVNKKGKFRGFAFIIYKNVDGAKACLVDPVKIVDGHELSCRLAIPRKGLAASAAPALGSGDEGVAKSNLESVDVSSRKVYVGNVPHGMKREKLLAHFSLYGEVEDEPLGFHRKAKSNRVIAKEYLETVDVSRRRVYIWNVPTEMECKKLLEHFSMYGEVEGGPLRFVNKKGKFRGFAFIIYKNVDGAKACLVDPVKIVDGHELSCRLAIPRKGLAASAAPALGSGVEGVAKSNLESVDVSSRKVYVGNVPHGMKREKLLAHFSLYGEVEDEPLGFHRKAKSNDGFAFIVYKNVEGAKACLVDPIKTIDGYQLHCRLAIPRKWNPSTVTAPAATAAQVQGSDNRGKRKFVNLEEQSSMQSSFVGGGRSGVSDYVGNMGGLGLPAGPYAHGISGYGGGGHGQPLEHSQHFVNLNLGGGFGLTSSLNNCGRPGLGLFSFGRNDGGQAPIGGGNGSSHFGGFGTSYGGTGSDGGVGPGNGANYGGTCNGEGAELGTGASYGGMHNGGGMELGTGFGAPSSSYGGIGTGGVGLLVLLVQAIYHIMACHQAMQE